MVVSMGIFASLIGLMPAAFYQYQPDYVLPTTRDQAVVDYFSANNITIYTSSWSGNLIYPVVISNTSGLPEGQSVELHWESLTAVDMSGNLVTGKALQFRHVMPGSILWIFPSPFPDVEAMTVDELPSNFYSVISADWFQSLIRNDVVTIHVRCSHILLSAVFLSKDNETTVMQSWNDGEMKVLVSYGIDWDAMKPSAWGLITQLVTFQKPSLGIPGDFGAFLSYAFGLGFWIVTAIIIYTILTRLIPTLQGGIEG
jgi:hypothetical protein